MYYLFGGLVGRLIVLSDVVSRATRSLAVPFVVGVLFFTMLVSTAFTVLTLAAGAAADYSQYVNVL